MPPSEPGAGGDNGAPAPEQRRMRLVVFGSTGGTGEQLIRRALAAGHHVTPVARRPAAVALTHPDLRVLPGDVLEPASLRGVIDGSDAVASAIGSQGHGPTRVYSEGISNVRAAMRRARVRRLVMISAVPVSAPEQKTTLDRLLIHPLLHRFFGGSYDDLHRMEHGLLDATDVDSTVFRPPQLTDGPATGNYRTALDARLPRARPVSRSDLAAAMIASLADPTLIGHTVTIAPLEIMRLLAGRWGREHRIASTSGRTRARAAETHRASIRHRIRVRDGGRLRGLAQITSPRG